MGRDNVQGGISALASVLRTHERAAARDLFMAKVTSSRALDDGCGITVPEDDYLVIKSAGELSEGMNVLAAWVDGCAVGIGVV